MGGPSGVRRAPAQVVEIGAPVGIIENPAASAQAAPGEPAPAASAPGSSAPASSEPPRPAGFEMPSPVLMRWAHGITAERQHYEIEFDILGEGTFGVVRRARRAGLDMDLAIKFLPGALVEDCPESATVGLA